MPLLLTEQDVATLLTMPELIEALESAFKRQHLGRTTNHPRRRIHAPGGTFHFMEAADFGIQRAAIKSYASFRPATRFLVHLYDTTNGDLLAIMEANRLGQMRTGAATGIATKYLAKKGSEKLALFGTGWQAESQAHAVAAVCSLKEINVYSRDAEKRAQFASRLSDQLQIQVTPAGSASSALKDADIVVTATTSRAPVFDGELIHRGVHVNAVGSNMLSKTEIDMATVARAGVVVVDSVEQAKLEAGDLIGLIEARRLRWEECIELSEIVSGNRAGRESDDQITLFKSNGIALEDVIAASLVYDRAVTHKVGKEIDLWV
jgi:alanine dehydrogenase